MIATHPEYPERFINNVIFTKDTVNEWLAASEQTKIEWAYEYIKNVPDFTHPSVINNQGKWADYEDVSINELKERLVWENNILTPLYKTDINFRNNRPVTPVKTGLTGRGLLGKFGPNHAADPIVTRHNPTTGELEFVAALRTDTNPPKWCIPGGMVDPGESVSQTLIREFKEEVASECKEEILNVIFREGNGTVLYAGPTYGDPRTTDMAWIETYVVHYHISNDMANLIKLTPQPGENSRVAWIKCNSEELYGDHKKFIDMAVNNVKVNRLKEKGVTFLGFITGIVLTIGITYLFRY